MKYALFICLFFFQLNQLVAMEDSKKPITQEFSMIIAKLQKIEINDPELFKALQQDTLEAQNYFNNDDEA